jgi:glycosyltransferase involved in cell wall biosynthesis
MRILVAVPVYNEQKSVVRVLQEIRRYADNILALDDGSTDDTPTLLAKLPVDVVRHAKNVGYGRSIRDAFRWANCYGYDWLITMDCDEQHEPASLPDFYQAIEEAERQSPQVDVISGSRYMHADHRNDLPPADRRAINMDITRIINQRLGLSLTDSFCGYKAYRTKALRGLELNVDGYAFPLQFWVQAVANDLRIEELPIRLIYNDPNRSFGGPLDDATHRRTHYMQVLNVELAKFPERFGEVHEAEPVAAGCMKT